MLSIGRYKRFRIGRWVSCGRYWMRADVIAMMLGIGRYRRFHIGCRGSYVRYRMLVDVTYRMLLGYIRYSVSGHTDHTPLMLGLSSICAKYRTAIFPYRIAITTQAQHFITTCTLSLSLHRINTPVHLVCYLMQGLCAPTSPRGLMCLLHPHGVEKYIARSLLYFYQSLNLPPGGRRARLDYGCRDPTQLVGRVARTNVNRHSLLCLHRMRRRGFYINFNDAIQLCLCSLDYII